MTLFSFDSKTSVYGTLIKRYKRFLCDIELDTGELITAHCPNPGRMTSCSEPGWRVKCSVFDDSKRKYAHRVDLIHNGHCWIGVNPQLANGMVRTAIESNIILPELNDEYLKSEVRYGEKSRVDFLHDNGLKKTFVEVKSVTYADDGIGYFPDAVSVRATKHLQGLVDMIKDGHRAVVVYCVQRSDITSVLPAKHIDLKYALAHEYAEANGVEFMPLFISIDGELGKYCVI